MIRFLIIIILGFFADFIIGDPVYSCHPVRLIGRCISFFECKLRRFGLGGKLGGLLLVLIVEGVTVFSYLALTFVFHQLFPPVGLIFDLFVCFSCLALRDLIHHIKPVAQYLMQDNIIDAKKALSMVVGRDVQFLNKTGVCRAAIETLAENFVDGFLAPLFWFLAGGIPAYLFGLEPLKPAISFMLAFKVVSTLDSMVGYRTPEFIKFGWAGARLDDVMNLLPARISFIVMFFGAWLSGIYPVDGFKTGLKDRLKHDSPNAGHAESFTAGALHIRLGGPTMYKDGLRNKPWLGENNPDPGPKEIISAILFIKTSALVAMIPPLFMLLMVIS